ncbi:glycosyltransferase [Sphingomonas sp. Leaf339]|uniref:glycosyltransferase n=1 Tax=Sphingomonas sp. Leaf339 TaxID=1736343 RepID=UPI0009E91833
MVAAEARASGLPLIVPDDGGAGDQFVMGQGRRYPAHDAAGLASAIIDFLADRSSRARTVAIAAAPGISDMGDHFAHRFGLYIAPPPPGYRWPLDWNHARIKASG